MEESSRVPDPDNLRKGGRHIGRDLPGWSYDSWTALGGELGAHHRAATGYAPSWWSPPAAGHLCALYHQLPREGCSHLPSTDGDIGTQES